MNSKYLQILFFLAFMGSYMVVCSNNFLIDPNYVKGFQFNNFHLRKNNKFLSNLSDDWSPIEQSFIPKFNLKDEEESDALDIIEFDCMNKLIIETDSKYTDACLKLTQSEPFKGLLEERSSDESPHSSYVFPPDDRNIIYDTTIYPWRTICKLYITASDNQRFIGSGAIIDEFHVLTCGHCVYLHDHGGWADQIEVVPAMDGYYYPFGSSYATYFRSYSGWVDSEMPEHDWALLTIDKSLGLYTGWMGRMTESPSSSIYTNIINSAGYPGDLDYGEYMYHTSDYGDRADDYNHWYWLDSAGGQSGSPVWSYDGTNRYILSVHAYEYVGGADANFGTRLDTTKFNDLNTWLSQNASSPPDDKADLVDRALYSDLTKNEVIAGESTLGISCEVENTGTMTATNFNVKFYASKDLYISSSDYLIGTTTIQSLNGFDYTLVDWYGIFPSSIPSGDFFVGFIIDEENIIEEYNENNNDALISYDILHVEQPPFNPLGLIIGGSIAGFVIAGIAYLISSTTRKIPDLDFDYDYSNYLNTYGSKFKASSPNKTGERVYHSQVRPKFCTTCGFPITINTAVFCPSCGKQLIK